MRVRMMERKRVKPVRYMLRWALFGIVISTAFGAKEMRELVLEFPGGKVSLRSDISHSWLSVRVLAFGGEADHSVHGVYSSARQC